jgi:hypothetical protein
MQRCVDFLLETASVEGGDAERPVTGETDELWRWWYPREEALLRRPAPWDNSNTQYAVLGLESAARCGIDVPGRVWLGIARHFLAVQAPDGPARNDLVLRAHGSSREATVVARRARARGWHYHVIHDPEPGRPPTGLTYGSMTTAGIGSLAIARSRIERLAAARRHAELVDRIDQAILDGFASLDDMFTVWTHPRYDGWYAYYLYGLERAGMLTSTERFGRHDWYWEGAIQLLLRRSDYGQGGPRAWSYDLGWTGTTAWAVLFLKRGTPPVITPR